MEMRRKFCVYELDQKMQFRVSNAQWNKYFKLYQLNQKMCCDPLDNHTDKLVTKELRVLSMDTVRLCHGYHLFLKKFVDHAEMSSQIRRIFGWHIGNWRRRYDWILIVWRSSARCIEKSSNALLAPNIPICEHGNQAENYSFVIQDAVQTYQWTNRQATVYLVTTHNRQLTKLTPAVI